MKSKAKIYQIVIVGLSIAAILAAVLFSSFSYAFTEVKQVSAAETDNNTSFNVALPASSGSSIMYDNVLVLTRASNFSGDWYDNEAYLRWYIDGSPHIFEEGSSFSFTLYAFCNSAFNFSLSGGAFYNTGLTGYVSIHSEGVSTDTSDCLYFNLSDQPIYVYNVFGTVTDTSGNVYNFSLFPDSNDDLFFDQIKSRPLSLNTNQTFVYPLTSNMTTGPMSMTYSGIGNFRVGFYMEDGTHLYDYDVIADSGGIANNKSYDFLINAPTGINVSYIVITALTDLDIYYLSFNYIGSSPIVDSQSLWNSVYDSIYNQTVSDIGTTEVWDFSRGYTSDGADLTYVSSSDTMSISTSSTSDPTYAQLGYIDIVSNILSGLNDLKGVIFTFRFNVTSLSSSSSVYCTPIFTSSLNTGARVLYVQDQRILLSSNSVISFAASSFTYYNEVLDGVGLQFTNADGTDFSLTLQGMTVTVLADYSSGYSNGYTSGYDSGVDIGYQQGYESGYNQGASLTTNDVLGVTSLGIILDGVYNILSTKIFGFFSIADLLYVFLIFSIFLFAMRVLKV